MAADTQSDVFEVEPLGDATVVRFTRRTILDPDMIATVGDRLLALFAQPGGQRHLILDFARVESLTSAMLGRLIALHQAIAAGGGRLVFCNVDPFLMQIFTICKVPDSVPVLPDLDAARRHLGEPAAALPSPPGGGEG